MILPDDSFISDDEEEYWYVVNRIIVGKTEKINKREMIFFLSKDHIA